MKKIKSIGILVFAIIMGITIYAFGSIDEVPKKVKDAFILKFPEVSFVQWEKESDTEWEAEFEIEGVEYSANFMADGTWAETEHEIRKRDIPKNIRAVLKLEFPKYKIKEAEISETLKGSVYEFLLKKSKINLEVAIDKKGAILKQEVVKDEDQND
ncbi:PepSY-like domain-containing protein [Zobellia laminariae]|uniref:PepSY-like domain-containing protein n=1 Tax=Zobellia laminariae TaxID=248906 RepID=UPI0026F46207|nr:PepSY-like domain-containing protein [Zobellia laminariae]WKX76912.1 PepSY-like domain-containing protein [Zobellia laminariae]